MLLSRQGKLLILPRLKASTPHGNGNIGTGVSVKAPVARRCTVVIHATLSNNDPHSPFFKGHAQFLTPESSSVGDECLRPM